MLSAKYDSYTIAVENVKLAFPSVTKIIKLYGKSDTDPVLTGHAYAKPFQVLKFRIVSGDWYDSYTPTPSPSGQSISVKEDKAVMPKIKLPGWPNYVAMGSVTDFNNLASIKSRGDADVIFKYAGFDGAGDNGQDPIYIFYHQAQAVIRTVDAAKELSVPNKPVIPVMVVYTTNASGGDQKEAEAQVTDLSLLTKHLSYLAIVSQYLQKNPVVKLGDVDVRGSLVINPDTYGEGNKDGYYKDVKPPVNQALLAMLAYLSNPPTGKPLISEVQKKGYTSQINELFPKNNDTSFKTYNQALNWVVHAFGKDVTYGFADNVWAGDVTGHTWLHKAAADPSVIQSHIEKEATYLVDNGVYGNPASYPNPSFIAFDKYERNTFVKGAPNVLANYLYNANDWSVYMQYVSGVSDYIGNLDKTIVPIMLFQIPGGHIPSKNDANWQYGATAPGYILGDKSVCDAANVSPILTGTKGMLLAKLNSAYGSYNIDKYSNYLSYLFAPILMNSYDNIHNGDCVWGGHMVDMINDHVFSILWGGGSTTSIAGPQDDGGYLSGMIKLYMHAPYDLQGNVLAQPY